MSEIRATTISNAAGTGPVTLTGQSAAKALVHFDQYYTNTIIGSMNVSSSSDDGTGQTTHNFTSSMSDLSYNRSAHGASSVSSSEYNARTETSGVTMTNASWKKVHIVTDNAAAYADVTNVFLLIHGDLA